MQITDDKDMKLGKRHDRLRPEAAWHLTVHKPQAVRIKKALINFHSTYVAQM